MFLTRFHVISFSYEISYQNIPRIYFWSGPSVKIFEPHVAYKSKALLKFGENVAAPQHPVIEAALSDPTK